MNMTCVACGETLTQGWKFCPCCGERASRAIGLPKEIDYPNFERLRTFVTGTLVYDIINTDCPPKDYEHYIFEIVMETFYGDKIWDWWNKV